MKEYHIFSQRLAGHLMAAGFKLVRMEPNRKTPRMNVFFFEDSEGLRQFVQAHITMHKREAV